MKRMLKFKICALLFAAVFTFVACEQDEDVKDTVSGLNVETVSIAEAKEILKEVFPQTRAGGSFIKPDLENIVQEALINSDEKMTVVPVTINGESAYSRILLFKIDGFVHKVILTMYASKDTQSEDFSGYLIVRSIKGEIVTGYRVSEGYLVSRLIFKKTIATKSKDGSESNPFDLFEGDEEIVCIGFSNKKNTVSLQHFDPRFSVTSGNSEVAPTLKEGSSIRYDYTSGGGGSSQNSNTETNDNNPTPKVNYEGIKGTKVECVKDKLVAGGENSLVNKLLRGFNLPKNSFKVSFYVKNISSGVDGKTIHDPNTGEIKVIINSHWLQRSSLELARTFLHESFHAYIFGKLYQEELHNSLPEPNFKKDFEEYERRFGKKNAQHNYMADKYRKHMKEGLKKYFKNEPYYQNAINNFAGNIYWVDEDFMLECLTWTGLKKTNAWKNFIKNDTIKQKYNEQYQFIINQLPEEKCEE